MEHYFFRSGNIEVLLCCANDLSKNKLFSKSRVKKCSQKVRVDFLPWPNDYQVAAI